MKSQNIVANPESVVMAGFGQAKRNKKEVRMARLHGKSASEPSRSTSNVGGIHGMDVDDWMQAERELQEKYKNNDEGTKKK